MARTLDLGADRQDRAQDTITVGDDTYVAHELPLATLLEVTSEQVTTERMVEAAKLVLGDQWDDFETKHQPTARDVKALVRFGLGLGDHPEGQASASS